MHLKNQPKYIRIVGDKECIKNAEIESIAINSLLSENSFWICEINRNACTNFIYGNALTEISKDEGVLDSSNLCLFEKLVNNLFTQEKSIKQYFEKNYANKVYFNKIKCSLLMIGNRTEDSECIYDLFQGLNTPLVTVSENGVKDISVLQVDTNDPVQLFNIINVAKRLQAEKSVTEKKPHHTLFIFDIESAIYDKDIDYFISDQIVQLYNKIYLLEYNCIESEIFIPNLSASRDDINNSIISFLKSLTSIMAKTSNFLLDIFYKAIFDCRFSSIIYIPSNEFNFIVDKHSNESDSFCNTKFNFWNKLSNESIYEYEGTLVSLIEKFHNYCCYFKHYYNFKHEGNENNSSEFSDLPKAIDDLKLILFNLCGQIMASEDLLLKIESTGDLYGLLNIENSLINGTPIDFQMIDQYLIDWCDKSEGSNESLVSSFREIYQDEYVHESNAFCANFTSEYRFDFEKFNKVEDSTYCLSQSNIELESELVNNRDKNQTYNLNKSVIGINDEFRRINLGSSNNHNQLNGLCEKQTRSFLSIPNHFKFNKHSETPLSKILFAVNTARRRVREYRHKQQAIKSSRTDETSEQASTLQSNPEKHIFWNKTLSKRPVFQYIKSNELEYNPQKEFSPQDEVEIYNVQLNSRKDAEVQVNTIDHEIELCVISDTNEGNFDKKSNFGSDSSEATENIYKGQFNGLNTISGMLSKAHNIS
ncbi:hypothetical protein OJ253_2374 [Cryptosporidium canis]|uniref:Uncharacterized protein n=1 Tax=Cryptosporidium canis TaxID=195482 RepID=A0A9D5DGK7_9CRYT|nr:hypothetical protein OJ253_2374 [Cryptosporidium canis]